MSDDVIDMSRTYIDASGWFLFGAHQGEHIDDVAADDPSYLEWMLREIVDLSDEVREDIEYACRGLRSRARPHGAGTVGSAFASREDKVESGLTLRIGDTVRVVRPISALLPVGTIAQVAARDAGGAFALRRHGIPFDMVAKPIQLPSLYLASVVVTKRGNAMFAQPGASAHPRSSPTTQVAGLFAGTPTTVPLNLAMMAARAAILRLLGARHALLVTQAQQTSSLATFSLPSLEEPEGIVSGLAAFELPSLEETPPSIASGPMWTWNEKQQEALTKLRSWAQGQGPRILSLTGFAGTGKSSLLREALSFMAMPHLCAMTGKAALRLRELTNRAASTLHVILYKPPDEQSSGNLDFAERREPSMATLVVDEASLITPKIYLDLEEWAAQGVRILLVGDPFQLPPILSKEEAAAWGEDFTVFEKVKGPVLTQVMRSFGPILDAATYIRETRRVQTKSVGAYRFTRSKSPMDAAISDYLADPIDHMLITWRNELRLTANRIIRGRMGKQSALPESGEPVLIRQNQGVYLNGEIVFADHWRQGPTIGGEYGDKEGLLTQWLRLTSGDEILTLPQGRDTFFDGGRPYIADWYAWRNYCRILERRPLDDHGSPCPIPVPVTYGFCLTAHAAQGSEARRVTVFLGSGDGESQHFRKLSQLPSGDKVPFASRWLYTALTRAREMATLHVYG